MDTKILEMILLEYRKTPLFLSIEDNLTTQEMLTLSMLLPLEWKPQEITLVKCSIPNRILVISSTNSFNNSNSSKISRCSSKDSNKLLTKVSLNKVNLLLLVLNTLNCSRTNRGELLKLMTSICSKTPLMEDQETSLIKLLERSQMLLMYRLENEAKVDFK